MLIPLSLSVIVLLAVVGLFMMNRKSTSNGQMGSFYGASKTPSGWDQETD